MSKEEALGCGFVTRSRVHDVIVNTDVAYYAREPMFACYDGLTNHPFGAFYMYTFIHTGRAARSNHSAIRLQRPAYIVPSIQNRPTEYTLTIHSTLQCSVMLAVSRNKTWT